MGSDYHVIKIMGGSQPVDNEDQGCFTDMLKDLPLLSREV